MTESESNYLISKQKEQILKDQILLQQNSQTFGFTWTRKCNRDKANQRAKSLNLK